MEKEKEEKKKVFSTGDSNVVTHHSTNPAHRCLTSEFRWDWGCSHLGMTEDKRFCGGCRYVNQKSCSPSQVLSTGAVKGVDDHN